VFPKLTYGTYLLGAMSLVSMYCSRVAGTCRRRCSRPSSFFCSDRCLRGFPPLLCKNVVVSEIRVLLFVVRYSLFPLFLFAAIIQGSGYPLFLPFAVL
jgi:hypothetical protein